MSRHIPDSLRTLVAERAKHRCEYCRLPTHASLFAFHIDHIISIKHGGETKSGNLALACQICNINKGTNIATILDDPLSPVRLFNPRVDFWEDHFEADEMGEVLPRTAIGQATIKVLDLNHPDSIIERRELIRLGLF
ncbi:MAG: HNH endonuclease [Saprospiraceae bacterium]